MFHMTAVKSSQTRSVQLLLVAAATSTPSTALAILCHSLLMVQSTLDAFSNALLIPLPLNTHPDTRTHHCLLVTSATDFHVFLRHLLTVTMATSIAV